MDARLRQQVAALVRERREALIQRTLDTLDAGPVPGVQVQLVATLGKRDIEQMIDGFISLLAEALETESRDVRQFFLETVIPGLLSGGATAPVIIGGVVEFAVLASVDITRALPAEVRDQAQIWFARFFNAYLAEMVQVTQRAAK